MRRFAAFVLVLSTVSIVSMPTQAAPTVPAEVAGSWKLVLLPFGEDEFAIVDVKTADGKLSTTVPSANEQVFGPTKAADLTVDGEKVDLKFTSPGNPASFNGVLDKDGKVARGSMKFRGTSYPARLEKTEAKAVAKLTPSPMGPKLASTQTVTEPKEKVAKILEIIGQNPGHPMNASAYTMLLGQAEAAKLGPDEVSKLITKWIDETKPYGTEWTADIESRALKALQGKKAYATLATEMALAADKALPADASTELRSERANMLARSAKLAGKDEIAVEAEARAKSLDGKLDAEYHEKVPPFKPESYAGRAEGKGNRVVLMEIFTGSECPPCVAADVAFDGLLKTYKPTEFIGLQHHLHIPRSDPMTNADTIARASYYGKEIGGTPSVFFNGKVLPGGGGGMAQSENKYKEYRKAVEPSLTSEKQADIKLTATRSGDEIKIAAKATIEGGSKEAKPSLRLVLVEETVRFPGGNKLRFHENVVRAFPGGVAGKALEKGEGTVETTVNLADLRKTQDAYLTSYVSSPGARGAFSNNLPLMEFNDLAVVALVQDDADHSIWHAVQVEVKSANP